jgi:hypothetical protein
MVQVATAAKPAQPCNAGRLVGRHPGRELAPWKIVNALLDAHFIARDGKVLLKEESHHDED